MAVSNIMSNIYATLLAYREAYIKALAGLIILCLALAGGYYGYRWYVVSREQKAQKIFSDCLQEYMEAHGGIQQWVNVEQLCKLGYEQNSGSHLAPYFLALEAESLVQQNKKQEAIALLDSMLNNLSIHSPVYNLYATKRAVLNLDMDDKTVQKVGFDQLQSLAQDTQNANRDMALYYLGLYHWSEDQIDQARDAWQELVSIQKQQVGSESGWAALVHDKLAMIS